MAKRDFLKLADLTIAEARSVLSLAAKLKQEPRGARHPQVEQVAVGGLAGFGAKEPCKVVGWWYYE